MLPIMRPHMGGHSAVRIRSRSCYKTHILQSASLSNCCVFSWSGAIGRARPAAVAIDAINVIINTLDPNTWFSLKSDAINITNPTPPSNSN